MADTKRTMRQGKPVGAPRRLFTQPLMGWQEGSSKPASGLKIGPDFAGATYDRALDHARLTGQLLRVFTLMRDGQWRTIDEIHDVLVVTGPIAHTGIGARLRDLRKPKFGGFNVETRRRKNSGGGLFEFRVSGGGAPC